jgi:hypothetical protein
MTCIRCLYISLLTAVLFWTVGCHTAAPMKVGRNGELVLATQPTSDWVAKLVEASPSFQHIVSRYPHIPACFQSVWHPDWFLESITPDEALVTIGAPGDPDFWCRSATLRVHRSGGVEREEMRDDGELVWVEDKYVAKPSF